MASERRQWWEARRLEYNIGLLVAGPMAFVLYALAAGILVPDSEITIFTMFFQAIAYLFMMGLANCCYELGPAMEHMVEPEKRAQYRERYFQLGYWFSVLLPFSIPLLIVLTYLPQRWS